MAESTRADVLPRRQKGVIRDERGVADPRKRALFGAAIKGGLALATLGVTGRGAYDTAIDIKEAVESGIRFFKSLDDFLYKKPGAIQISEGGVEIRSIAKPTEFSRLFHDLEPSGQAVAGKIAREMHGVIATNPEYINGSLVDITKKHEQAIRDMAKQYGVDPSLALGIVFVENGGGEKIRNKNSGAMGVAQLMEVTAKRYGLKVEGGVDDRMDPAKSVETMCKYLADLKREFMDQGLAVWGYHAGEGNVYDALRSYFKNVDGRDYGDAITNANAGETYRKLIVERKVNLHKVLQNPGVQKEVLSNLTDETELYGYKVLAGYQLYDMNTGQIPA